MAHGYTVRGLTVIKGNNDVVRRLEVDRFLLGPPGYGDDRVDNCDKLLATIAAEPVVNARATEVHYC